jgi:hypothetical protein
MTQGSTIVNGYDVYSEQSKARHFMGYCPQYDGLIGLCKLLICILNVCSDADRPRAPQDVRPTARNSGIGA